MHVLAIVSKAIFEKQPLRTPGEVWPTDAYVSANPNLSPLKSGGLLYLVTVRSGDQLLLVGVLDDPCFERDAWRAAPNRAPITDITALIPKLRFANGKGLAAAPGKLGMSLQTPRGLSAEDVALLDRALGRNAATPTTASAYASAVATTPKAQAADALAARLAAEAAARGLEPLRFERYRRYSTFKSATAAEKKQLDEIRFELEGAEEFDGFEMIDVVRAGGEVAYTFVLWPFGSGVVLEGKTDTILADVIQHGYGPREVNPKLRESLAVAYHESAKALGIREHVDFSPTEAETKPRPQATPAAGPLLDEAAALRKTIAADTSQRKQASAKAVWELVPKLVPVSKSSKDYRPFPVKRPFELTAEERAAMEVLVDAGLYSGYFAGLGFPDAVDDLAKFIGAAPPTALDAPVVVEGKPHPAWCLVSDALYDQRSTAEVLDRLATLPADIGDALWTELVTTDAHHLREPIPRTREELGKGLTPKLVGAFARRFLEFLVDFNLRLGDRGEHLASALIGDRAAWIAERKAAGSAVGYLYGLDEVLPVLVALSSLAERARRAGGVLDSAHAPLVEAVALAAGSFEPVASVIALLERLPPEWAAAAAQGEIALVERFPSREGAEKVIRRFESVKETWLRGPYYEGLLASMLKEVGEPARALLEESLGRDHARKDLMKAMLAKVSAKKAPTAKKKK